MTATATLTGSQKAALLLLQLGRDRAARVLKQLDEYEIEELTAEIVRLEHVDQSLADEVVDEFWSAITLGVGVGGGSILAEKLLINALGEERAAEMMGRLEAVLAGQPFDFLQQVDARQIVSLLSGEHPQTVALVLAYLRPEHASMVLAGLPPDDQAEIAHRIALMERASPDLVQVVAESLQRKASAVLAPRELANVGGVQPLVEIINRADPATEKSILEGLADRDEELAEEIRSRMFVFADIVLLDDRAMQLVLRQVDTSGLALALKGSPDAVRDVVMRNVSQRARENLVEEIDLLGPVRLSQVEDARAAIVQVIRRLEESGQITIRRDGEDEYVA